MADTIETKAKIRFGRVLLVLVILVALYWLVSWVRGNADTIQSMHKNMQTLSAQLEEQKSQVQNLNRALSQFSGGLGQLQQNIQQMQSQAETHNQTASHTLDEISNNVLNMKGKIDVLSAQSGSRGGYYR